MKLFLVKIAIAGFFILSLSGCGGQTSIKSPPNETSYSASQTSGTEAEQETEAQTSSPAESESLTSQAGLVSYWDEFAKNNGGPKACFGDRPIDVDLLPLYLAGMKHEDAYVRWVCAYKAFDYHWDNRKPEILKALEPLLTDPVPQVQEAAKFSTEVLAETFSGPEFVHSPNGKDVAFTAYNHVRFNDGKVWVYTGENKLLSMVLQLLSVGGDSGVAGGIQWSPDGSKLAVGDGGRLWSNTVILKLATLTVNKQDLFSYLGENSKKYGYKIDGYQRPDPSVRFVEWSPDSKKVLLSYYFAEDPEKWQSGFAVYNCETNKYEKIMPNAATSKEYPQFEKPADFYW